MLPLAGERYAPVGLSAFSGISRKGTLRRNTAGVVRCRGPCPPDGPPHLGKDARIVLATRTVLPWSRNKGCGARGAGGDVGGVKSGSRFVQDVKDPGKTAAQLGGQARPLQFPAGKSVCLPVQGEVGKAQFVQEAHALVDLLHERVQRRRQGTRVRRSTLRPCLPAVEPSVPPGLGAVRRVHE